MLETETGVVNSTGCVCNLKFRRIGGYKKIIKELQFNEAFPWYSSVEREDDTKPHPAAMHLLVSIGHAI